MIQQAGDKKMSTSEDFALQNEIVFKLKQERTQPLESGKNLIGEEQLAPKQKQAKQQSQTSAVHLDLGQEIQKLIQIYSKTQKKDELTFDQFKELAKDLYSMIQPRQLTKQELDNLVNLFDQKQKDTKNAKDKVQNQHQGYKPPKTTITKDELKKKATQNKGSLVSFKKK